MQIEGVLNLNTFLKKLNMLKLHQLDYFVLPVASVRRSSKFYSDKLGVDVLKDKNNQTFISTGSHKIKLQPLGISSYHKPRNTFPGCNEICFLTQLPLHEVKETLINKNVSLLSYNQDQSNIPFISLHDPDGNLLIIKNQ